MYASVARLNKTKDDRKYLDLKVRKQVGSNLLQRKKEGSKLVDIAELPESQAKLYMIAAFKKGEYKPPLIDDKGTLQLKPTKSSYKGGEMFSVSKADLNTGTDTTKDTRDYVNDPSTFKPTFIQFQYLISNGLKTSLPVNMTYKADNPKASTGYASGSYYDAGHKLASQNGGLGDDRNWVFPQNPAFNQGNSRFMTSAEKTTYGKTNPYWRGHEQFFHDEVQKHGYGIWWLELS
ncbi:hypothetical protein [Spartinivicinus poritis]|uniref:DNA/RNA non-specific endonuclease n=1 Tax=Spartinivicinus poritis TaxID=2994640 RepID=A0ABT5U9H6_9GAMM|nr:hypothetical protein [Spartinivicinus sp. A2-2]MDE1462118.1 hypothetical protein [Spartinivicinus sp. A2-2]